MRGVLIVVLVSLRAVSDRGVASGDRLTPMQIHGSSHGLEMIRVHTLSVPAEVVKVVTHRNFTFRLLVKVPMGDP